MSAPLRVLVVEDEAPLRELLVRQLGRHGHEVSAASSAEEALAAAPPDVAICDISLPGLSGIDLIRRLRASSPHVECIVLTGQGSIATAIEAMKLGAFHYFEKPVRLKELERYVQGAGEKRRLAIERQAAAGAAASASAVRTSSGGFPRGGRPPELVGSSAAVEAMRALVARVAASSAPVLIEGETGTGKDLVARAIHAGSPRRERPFVAINCGALAESLLENELFGHVAGAFTGASQEQRGVFEVADQGTLFIDEVGEMSLDIQKKFLRVLEDGEFRRLGESRTRVADVRIVAATNRVLKEHVARGLFREDLYYRLAVLSIRTPALREHKEDLPDLVDELLARVAAQGGRRVTIAPEVIDALAAHPWPGNVRELRNVVERIVVLAPTSTVRLEDCAGHLPEAAPAAAPPSGPAARPAALSASSDGGDPDTSNLEDVEREHIRGVLAACDGNKTQAARRLGVSLRSLYRRLEKLGLK